jgi:hypothetical protein
MALYSKKVPIKYLTLMADSAGTLSKDSYLLVEVTGVTVSDGDTKATLKFSLYGKSSTKRSVSAEIIMNGDSASKTVTATTSLSCILTTTKIIDCYESISISTSAYLQYTVKGTYVDTIYGLTTEKELLDVTNITFVTFGAFSTYPKTMRYGTSGEFTFSKSASYRLEFSDSSGVVRYTASLTGSSGSITVPVSVFKESGTNLTSCALYELSGSTDIARKTYYINVTETSCSLSLLAIRTPSDTDESLVTVTLSGQSALSSTARNITIYAKETSSTAWNKVGETSPADSSFADITVSFDLDISYAWDIYGTIEDGYTTAESGKVRVYSKAYIMDVRTDGKGAAFGGTAANSDELYVGWKTLRANNIIPTDITGIANLIYPIGSIYVSLRETSPAVIFGGSWQQIAGKFLYALDGSLAPGDVGGEANHTLTTDEMPSHTHTEDKHRHSMDNIWSNGTGSDTAYVVTTKRTLRTRYTEYTTPTINATGGGAAHNNMPPYFAVYMWYRTA